MRRYYSREAQPNEKLDAEHSNGGIILVTVARLSYEKGIDIAIMAARELKNKGLVFEWFVVGDCRKAGTTKKYEMLLRLKNPHIMRLAFFFYPMIRYAGSKISNKGVL